MNNTTLNHNEVLELQLQACRLYNLYNEKYRFKYTLEEFIVRYITGKLEV